VSDAELARRARAGDVGALERLYHAHVDRVYALCLRMVRNQARAEELTQDTWVRVWESMGSFRGDAAFSTWLHRVTVNVVLQSERAARRRGRRFPLTATPDRHERAPETDEMDSRASRITLERAVARLPPQARAVLVLHDIQGHTHSEIAEMLAIAEGTSRAHLYQARERLREALRR
jgi:RNA polymerase sigma-70 factor (ECF subfamily)